jgi:hypothetical protein
MAELESAPLPGTHVLIPYCPSIVNDTVPVSLRSWVDKVLAQLEVNKEQLAKIKEEEAANKEAEAKTKEKEGYVVWESPEEKTPVNPPKKTGVKFMAKKKPVEGPKGPGVM